MIFGSNIDLNETSIILYVKDVVKNHYDFFKDNILINDYFIFIRDYNNLYGFEGTRKEYKKLSYQVVAISNKIKYSPLLQHIIAHEHLHKWFGGRIVKQKPEVQVENAWFIEGFTDYYSAYLNYKYEIWDLDQYLVSYNDCLYKNILPHH